MEERLSMVTTECEKVQIITAITSVQTLRHGRQRKKTTRTLSVTNEHQNFWCLWDPGCPVTPTSPGGTPCFAGGPHVSPFLRDMGSCRITRPKQPPRIAVIVKRRSAQVRINIYDLARSERGQRQNVPEVFRNDVSGHEINFVDRIWNVAKAGALDLIRRPAPRRLHLNPPQTMAAGEDEVEAVAVSPWLGHAESERGRRPSQACSERS